MRHTFAFKLILNIALSLVLGGCQSTSPKSTAPYKVATVDDVEIVWAAGMRGLKPRLGLAGSCPTPEYYAHEIPNDLGVGFGICFIPRIKGAHGNFGIRYTVTLPGEGAINPATNERVKQVSALTNCFNGLPCFGGYIPDQYDFLPGEWLFEFYRLDRKIIEFRFVVKAHTKENI